MIFIKIVLCELVTNHETSMVYIEGLDTNLGPDKGVGGGASVSAGDKGGGGCWWWHLRQWVVASGRCARWHRGRSLPRRKCASDCSLIYSAPSPANGEIRLDDPTRLSACGTTRPLRWMPAATYCSRSPIWSPSTASHGLRP